MFDDSIEKNDRIERILQELNTERAEPAGPGEAADRRTEAERAIPTSPRHDDQ